MKHIPNPGRAFSDSHPALPKVDAPLDALRAHDFAPFKTLSHPPMAMTAHVVYDDRSRAAGHDMAQVIEEIVRGEIGFDGLLISDDMSMKALSGDYSEKAAAILAAGCDIVLHCNGVVGKMTGIASRTTALDGKVLERAERALRYGKGADGTHEAFRAEFANISRRPLSRPQQGELRKRGREQASQTGQGRAHGAALGGGR